jgi:hypothetical protein
VKVKMSIARKEGRPDYGSDCVGLEIELDVPDTVFSDFALLQVHVLEGYDHIERFVAERLEKLRPEAPARAESPPARPARQEPPAAPERPTAHRNDGGVYQGRPSGPPRSGKELLGWARRHGRDAELISLGRAWRLPPRVLDWEPQDVADVHATMTATDPPRNGNGAAY